MSGAIIPLLVIIVWQISSRLSGFPIQTLSEPYSICLALIESFANGSLMKATMETMVSAFGGLALGSAFGTLAGVAMGVSVQTDRMTSDIVEFLRPIPAIAILPLALLFFGFGPLMEMSVVAFAVFWPVLVITRTATMGINPIAMEVASALELTAADRLRKILLPSIVRELFVALKIGVGVAFVVAVTVEIVLNPQGLGYQLVLGQVGLRPDLVFAALFWVGAVGWSVSAGFDVLLRGLFPWWEEAR